MLSNHLLLEYEEVLQRNAATLSLAPADVDSFLKAICQAERVQTRLHSVLDIGGLAGGMIDRSQLNPAEE